MKRLLIWSAALLCGLCAGSLSAIWAISDTGSAPIVNGPWRCDPLAGSRVAGAYLRARVALEGPLALSQEESIYFNASTDSAGQLLQSGSSYRVDFAAIDCRWWSITAYGPNGFLIPNPIGRYSFTSENLPYLSNGLPALLISRESHTDPWLPLGDSKSFNLLLRIYEVPAESLRKLSELPLPTITKIQ